MRPINAHPASEQIDSADDLHEIHYGIIKVVADHEPDKSLTPLAGGAFYQRAKHAHVVVSTSEPNWYANVILRKGVIRL